MISCDKGQIKIEGSKSMIMSEVACLLEALTDVDDNGHQILTEEEVDRCIELAKMSADEIAEKSKKLAEEMSSVQLFGALFGALADM